MFRMILRFTMVPGRVVIPIPSHGGKNSIYMEVCYPCPISATLKYKEGDVKPS